ncbi:MAG: prepilin-type N-terminal cleavage/methylation domain-containing protein [Coxiellaceae bacterium]|nr:prepilin-type N-terminal cleavage/methylation domain-containing protein [Coxiellaceae bacterium]
MYPNFTLIESVIVLAISSILSLVSFPLYNEYLKKHDVFIYVTVLLDIASRMEKYYVLNKTL